ncbi:hypothetical protein Zmor_013094 [Zophobas morio]|uniref:Uncharacterized protein n=1 Tax=Zophobas morio TaxID=2755281 RepID=A0AA38IA57_9CUCU|nr:hypothetical protein Zmor_013094 [Zophobas morio]
MTQFAKWTLFQTPETFFFSISHSVLVSFIALINPKAAHRSSRMEEVRQSSFSINLFFLRRLSTDGREEDRPLALIIAAPIRTIQFRVMNIDVGVSRSRNVLRRLPVCAEEMLMTCEK